MKSVKEQVVDNIILSMSHELEESQLTKLLYNVSYILKDVEITVKQEVTLPDVLYDNENKIIEAFLSCKKLNGCTESTIQRYRMICNRFLLSIGDKSLLSVTSNDIRCFLAVCSKTMNSVSMDGFRLGLNSFYTWLVQEEIIEKNPCVKVPKIRSDKKVKRPVTQLELVRLKDCCVDLRERVFIDLLDSCGLRSMEVPTIKIEDINFFAHTLKVYGKGKKEREVILSEECIEHVVKYLEWRAKEGISSKYLICRKHNPNNNIALSKNAIHDMMKTICERAGEKDIHIHGMRRKFASDMSRKGMNITSIQKLLGHSSIMTTQIYISSDYGNVINEYNKYKN